MTRDRRTDQALRGVCRDREDRVSSIKRGSDVRAWRSERERDAVTRLHAQRLQPDAGREKAYQRNN